MPKLDFLVVDGGAFEPRKLILLGQSSWVLTLPRTWLDFNAVERGGALWVKWELAGDSITIRGLSGVEAEALSKALNEEAP